MEKYFLVPVPSCTFKLCKGTTISEEKFNDFVKESPYDYITSRDESILYLDKNLDISQNRETLLDLHLCLEDNSYKIIFKIEDFPYDIIFLSEMFIKSNFDFCKFSINTLLEKTERTIVNKDLIECYNHFGHKISDIEDRIKDLEADLENSKKERDDLIKRKDDLYNVLLPSEKLLIEIFKKY